MGVCHSVKGVLFVCIYRYKFWQNGQLVSFLKIENYNNNQTSKNNITLSSQILNKSSEVSDFHITHPKNYKY